MVITGRWIALLHNDVPQLKFESLLAILAGFPAGTLLCMRRIAILLVVVTGIAPSYGQRAALDRAQVIGELRKGNSDGALSLANQALRQRPSDCGILSLKAVALANLAQPQAALASFQQALVHCPSYLPALEGAAQIEYAQHASGTVPLLVRVLTLDSGNVPAHAMMASMLRGDDRCEEALPHFEASRSFFPRRPDLLEGYGFCLAQSGNLKAALAQYAQLLESNPNDKVRYDVALLQWKAHDDGGALATLAPLIEAARDEPAFALASKICEEQSDTPRAVDLLRRAILMAPDQTDNYLDFADIAFTHKSFQVGIDMVNAGLRRMPNSAQLYVARGVLEVQVSRTDEAIADFEQAHRLDPTLSFAVDAMGIMQSQQHQSAKSLSLFEAQVKLHPDDPLLQYLLAEQLAGDTADPANGNLAAAIAAAKRATALDPRYKAAHDLLAVLYVRSGQPTLAIEQAELALAQDPDDQGALYQEIMATRRTGQNSRVAVLVARLKEIRKENERKQQSIDRYRLQDAASP